jgi:hypothetical protein
MDTFWYAVDKDGRVACFYTGESGAVPLAAADEEATDRIRGELERLLPPCAFCFDRQGWPQLGDSADGSGSFIYEHRASAPLLMFLRSLDLVRDELASGIARQLPSTSDFAVWFWDVLDRQTAVMQRLPDRGECLGCFEYWGMDERDGACDDAASRGLFAYTHACETWISGPYGRILVPTQPVHVDQLPPALRQHIKSLHFDVDFSSTPYLQPLQHGEGVSMETHWLDRDGRTKHTMTHRRTDMDVLPTSEDDLEEDTTESEG